MDMVLELYSLVLEKSIKRNFTLISIGGGITQDVTGFVASTLFRGIKWIYIPTTLLAQSDSCIGSKTSLNYKDYKNLIGTFYPPDNIYICTEFLNSLSNSDYLSGMGEVVKLNILAGEENILKMKNTPKFFDQDNKNLSDVIFEALMIKKDYIESDELDKGRRNYLNYGHCFGHAIEFESQYQVPHGQAVVMGMILANIVSFNRNELSFEKEEFLRKEILAKLLPNELLRYQFNKKAIANAMKKDKKREGTDLPLILIDDKYRPSRINDLKIDEVYNSLDKYESLFR